MSIERIGIARPRAFIGECLLRIGLPLDDADTCARLMADAQAQGFEGDGVFA